MLTEIVRLELHGTVRQSDKLYLVDRGTIDQRLVAIGNERIEPGIGDVHGAEVPKAAAR